MDNQKKISTIKIRTITFHRAQNHGSILQTYALQTFIKKIGEKLGIEIEYQVIDYYPEIQKDLYSIIRRSISLKDNIKNIINILHIKSLISRRNRFTDFLKKYIHLTQTYSSEQELQNNPPEADIYLCGSDQIWNVRAKDFSEVYYLNFGNKRTKRISFATSFGPLKINWKQYNQTEIAKFLNIFDKISVREEGSADNVENLIRVRPEVIADPTFLLNRSEWEIIENKEFTEKTPYILLYVLEPTKTQLKTVDTISKITGLPVVVLRYNNKNDYFNRYVKRYTTGPSEFLSYFANASLIITSSFHGTAFSIIYQKPFYVLDGAQDVRIYSILEKTGLTERIIDSNKNLFKIDLESPKFEKSEHFVKYNLSAAEEYIQEAIGL